jgi:hypothetical protein
MIREEELKRLIKYVEGMGIKVKMLSSNDERNSASWSLDGTLIEVHNSKSKAKIDLVLDMIHEISHHLWFIHQKERQLDLKFEEAIERQDLYEENGVSTPAPKKLRKKILSVEIAGTAYWETVYKETNMKFPIWKLHAQKEFDVWMYEMYYEVGRFPSSRDRKQKMKEINLKYRPSSKSKIS